MLFGYFAAVLTVFLCMRRPSKWGTAHLYSFITCPLPHIPQRDCYPTPANSLESTLLILSSGPSCGLLTGPQLSPGSASSAKAFPPFMRELTNHLSECPPGALQASPGPMPGLVPVLYLFHMPQRHSLSPHVERCHSP